MATYATITLELSKAGIHAICEDIDEDVFCPRSDKECDIQPLVDLINTAEELCNPDTTYRLTDYAKKMIEEGRMDELLEGGAE